MRTTRRSTIAFVGIVMLAPSVASATPIGVVKESGRLAGYAVRDSVQTVGWTIRDFFVHGPRAAKHSWKAGAARTRYDAHVGKRRVAWEAHDER